MKRNETLGPGSQAHRQRRGKLMFLLLAVLAGFLVVPAGQAPAVTRLKMATTTSVQDSGLMSYLLPYFEKRCGCKVDVIAVGSGQALRLAENGDVDLILVHDPAGEQEFVSRGLGINRRTIMVNDFVILGPPSDPAGIKGAKDAVQAFTAIYKTRSTFISRGDASGTHQKELAVWKKANIKPTGRWYLEVGQGMGAVLTMAHEKKAYTISDRGSYVMRMKQLTNLRILVEGDANLINPYSVMQVNPGRFPSVQSDLARQLIEWLSSGQGQDLIASYTVDGHLLFRPVLGYGN